MCFMILFAQANKHDKSKTAYSIAPAPPKLFNSSSQQLHTDNILKGSIIYVQRAIANQAAQHSLDLHSRAGASVQPKLTMNAPGDLYEQEADRVANRLVKSQMPAGQCELQRKKAEEGKAIQVTRTLNPNISHSSKEGSHEDPFMIQQVFESRGQPLESDLRTFFEPHFGRDFSRVRIHTDTEAAESARVINAQAYTIGNDIVFNRGQYQPSTNEGKRLIAHELTHVVQQSDIASSKQAATALQRQPVVGGAKHDYSSDVCESMEEGGVCNAPELETLPARVDFGQVAVGQRKLAKITVKNSDARHAITIDSARAINYGLLNFEAYGISATLQPGATKDISIGFAPTAEGPMLGGIEVAADHGTTLGYVEVLGKGTETKEDRENRIRIQDISTKAAREKKDPTLSHFQQRSVAEADVHKWYKVVNNLLEKTAIHLSTNWTRFLADTGGDFSVSWTEGQFINAVGAVGSGIAGLMSKSNAVNFVLSVLFSLIYGGSFTAKGNKSAEETVYSKVKQTGRASEDQQNRFEDEKDTALSHAQAMESTALSKIWSAKDVNEISEIQSWAKREIENAPSAPKRGDISLYKHLLEDWVLERAGDARNAGKNTNEPAYKAARETAFGLKGGAALSRDDLFIYQARYEWGQLSLDGIEQAETELRAKLDEYKKQGLEAGIIKEADLTQYILNMMGEEVWKFFWVKKPEQTAHVLQQINVNVQPKDLRNRQLGCQMWLRRDGNSIIVRKYMYHVDRYIGERSPK